jgi:ATP-binding cassette subfamily F protein 3
MLQLSGLTKTFGDRVLLEDVTWQISKRERVGLAGPNGAGKTTLLKMLAGLEEPDGGGIVRPSALTVGYLPQDGLTHEGRTLFEEASAAFQDLLDMKEEIHTLEHRLGDASVPEEEHHRMLDRYSELQDEFRHCDGYSMDLKVATVLHGLGFRDGDFAKRTETFSGGWQMRIALARLLLGRPNLLLLDEPTNHLDLEARNWLEEYLVEYPHAVILVSHDRFFLDAVVTRITEIWLRKLNDYPGTYTHYLEERDRRVEQLRDLKRQQDEEIARMRLFIDRFRYQATKASQVQSRIKMLEKIVPIEVPPERKRVHFTFPVAPKSGRIVLELKGVRKAYDDLVVFRHLDLHIERGDRIALVGPNGAGKSTLMRMLAGAEQPDRGTRIEGHQLVVQYFAQDEAARLDPRLTVYETLETGSPVHMVPAIRNILGGFLFSGDDVQKKAAVLSGGERTRLAVARMLLRPANTLLLDEPTNHLDIDSKDVLLDALIDFGGTLLFVSHDRYFVDKLATKIVEVGNGEAVLYPGTYEEFLSRKQQLEKAERKVDGGARLQPGRQVLTKQEPLLDRPKARLKPGTRPANQSVNGNGASREEKKRADAETRRQQRQKDALQARIARLESQIADRERAIKEIEATMSAPGFYEDREAARPIIDRHQALMWEVGDLMNQWEALQSTLVATSFNSERPPPQL